MTNPLMDLIGSGEGDYNSYNRGTLEGEDGKYTILPANHKVDFSTMTIGEIKRRQALHISHPDRMLAVGRYQFITQNLAEATDTLNIKDSEVFNPDLQDRLFNEYLLPTKRRQVHNYVTGKEGATLHGAQKAICKEWASVEDPDTPGHVYAPYERSGNRMHTRAAEIAVVLDEMRGDYRARLQQGMSPAEAWSATTTMGPGQNAQALRGHSARNAVGSVMRLGAHGVAVGELQSQLTRLGYTDNRGQPLTADGHFGENTRLAVEAFQRDHALTADGIAGRATLAAVQQAVRTELRSIGQADAEYLRGVERDEALSAYQSLPQHSVSSEPLMPSIEAAAPRVDALQAAAFQAPDADAVRVLQKNLNTLGVPDMHGEPLAVHGIYDVPTQTAVARFQSDHGLPVTGQADETTYSRVQGQAFVADLQHAVQPAVSRDVPIIEMTRPPVADDARPIPSNVQASSWDQSPQQRTTNDPRHPESPDHALLNEMQRCLPDASEDRHLQFTAACHANRITVDNLRGIHVDEDAMTVDIRGTGPLTTPVTIDMNLPPPKPEQAIEQIQSFDQREVQMMQEIQTQNMQLSQGGPTR